MLRETVSRPSSPQKGSGASFGSRAGSPARQRRAIVFGSRVPSPGAQGNLQITRYWQCLPALYGLQLAMLATLLYNIII